MRAINPPLKYPLKPIKFVGREREKARIQKIIDAKEASIIVVYGRRRVGKTELIEQSFYKRNLIKIEGLEGRSESEQRQAAVEQLATLTKDPLYSKLLIRTWRDFFDVLWQITKRGVWTIYFEELQWIACYKADFASDLKFYWDNYFSKNPNLIIVLCGSSPSFMRKGIVKSKALYNRSIYEIPLEPFSLAESREYLGSRFSLESVVDAYLTLGGIPEYLKYLKKEPSLYKFVCDNSFVPGGFLAEEWDRIFVSSLAENPKFQELLFFLTRRKYATRPELVQALKLSNGGATTKVLQELESCGFIESYRPVGSKTNSRQIRFCISDYYLYFFGRSVHPKLSKIRQGDYIDNPGLAMSVENFRQGLGFAFEFFCRRNHRLIAKILGFSAVEYQAGALFSRGTSQIPGYQLDLVFKRADRVMTVCEIKYLNKPVDLSVVRKFEQRLALLERPARYNLQKVLLAPGMVTSKVRSGGYFDWIIGLEDLFAGS